MKKTKLLTLFVLSLVLSLFVTACGQKAEGVAETNTTTAPKTFKLSVCVNEKDGFYVAAAKFKELVEQQSNGKVLIEIFPNSTLGDERTTIEGMQAGTIDMGVVTCGPIANFVPEISVFEMPFLFASPEEAYKILDGSVGDQMLTKLDNVNLKGLAYAERGFRNVTNSKRPISKPEDLKGLKIRVMENPMYIDAFSALGANAVPMAWTETLTALQQGTIDGQENPINVVYSFKLYETQKYLSITQHTYSPALILVGKSTFEGLDKETQELFYNAAKEAAVYERKWNAEQMDSQMKFIKEQGVEVIEPDLALFKEAMKPVYEKYTGKFGNLLEEIQVQLGNK